ncbi:uncharacterized protein BDR25DRAFT_13138 [Lindgomyces ingoldianus]|uniref:Uncharacterized protein n=1 Tax=Lindgomyces ingoldianus TaxID=673940 RepID=A0ACB6R136_9PLEO|nr:uncharacterized protein BDR25DRAFT_13138 [Lindgomyces ingoldianus]KAF2473004.1 hypothetical protein BDR25DRAFT_13138 [Lindgomyces ingoldianus]
MRRVTHLQSCVQRVMQEGEKYIGRLSILLRTQSPSTINFNVHTKTIQYICRQTPPNAPHRTAPYFTAPHRIASHQNAPT